MNKPASPGRSLNSPTLTSVGVSSLLGDLVVPVDGPVVPFKTHHVMVVRKWQAKMLSAAKHLIHLCILPTSASVIPNYEHAISYKSSISLLDISKISYNLIIYLFDLSDKLFVRKHWVSDILQHRFFFPVLHNKWDCEGQNSELFSLVLRCRKSYS